ARIVDDKVAEAMRLPAGQPIFSWDEVVYDLNDRPIFYAEIYFNTAIVPLCTMGKIEPNM
ncbi:MAG TPA: UTRA domain-containing protein, partial [Bacillota bacterium]